MEATSSERHHDYLGDDIRHRRRRVHRGLVRQLMNENPIRMTTEQWKRRLLIVQLREQHHLTFREIGERLGIHGGRAHPLYYSTVQRLKRPAKIRFTSGETGGKGWAESGVGTAMHEQQEH